VWRTVPVAVPAFVPRRCRQEPAIAAECHPDDPTSRSFQGPQIVSRWQVKKDHILLKRHGQQLAIGALVHPGCAAEPGEEESSVTQHGGRLRRRSRWIASTGQG
jgi:hypothetical protein